jgi:4-hydroxybenzoate polyprenyltransferase
MKSGNWVKGVFLASRIPNLLIIGITQLLGALMLIRHGLADSLQIEFFFLAISTMMVAAGGYIINDYYDLKIDMVNRPSKVIVGRDLSRRKALIAHMSISSMAIILGFMVSVQVAMIHVFSVGILWLYSNQLRRLLIGKTVIACLTAISILLVGFTYGVVSYRLMGFATFGAAIIWSREMIKDLENAEGEKAFGVQSMAGVLGAVVIKWLIMVIATICGALMTYFIIKVNSPLFTNYYLFIVPLVVLFIFFLLRADTKHKYRNLRYLINALILAGVISMLVV